jgi:hypothetical protein
MNTRNSFHDRQHECWSRLKNKAAEAATAEEYFPPLPGKVHLLMVIPVGVAKHMMNEHEEKL